MGNTEATDLLADIVAGDVARLRPPLALTGDPQGMPPLLIAAACGNEVLVEKLLQHGADPAQRDARGRTAAAYARAAGFPHLAARLDTVVDKENTIW